MMIIGLFCLGSNASPPVEKPAPVPQGQSPSTVENKPPASTAPTKPSSNAKCTQEGFMGDRNDCR